MGSVAPGSRAMPASSPGSQPSGPAILSEVCGQLFLAQVLLYCIRGDGVDIRIPLCTGRHFCRSSAENETSSTGSSPADATPLEPPNAVAQMASVSAALHSMPEDENEQQNVDTNEQQHLIHALVDALYSDDQDHAAYAAGRCVSLPGCVAVPSRICATYNPR